MSRYIIERFRSRKVLIARALAQGLAILLMIIHDLNLAARFSDNLYIKIFSC
jgi:ABC-type hemin transport system ATPase subunit